MFLYGISNNNLEKIEEKPFPKEVELHKLCDSNLENIFGLKFVRREFSINNYRLDTLAFDESNNSFVIIEYKNTSNYSVIDQGYVYLSLMLSNKADFILEYNDNCNNSLKRNDINWSQSRIIFVSPIFNNYQLDSINYKDLPFELWEVKRFANNTIYFNQIKSYTKSKSIKKISTNNDEVNKLSKQEIVYTERNHINNSNEEVIRLYEKIKKFIVSLDDTIEIKCKKYEIGFVYNERVMIDIHLQKKSLKIWLNTKMGTLNKSNNLIRDVSEIGHWGNGDYEIHINNSDEIEYIYDIIKQLYELKCKE
jgi:predicted transport protein